MIVTAAMFVENDDEHRLLPRFNIAAQRIVHGGDELVAEANDMRRMHIVGQIDLWRKQAYVRIITRLDEGIIRQGALARMAQEGIEHVEILGFSNKLRQCQRLRKVVVVKRPAGLGWRPVEGGENRRHLENKRLWVYVSRNLRPFPYARKVCPATSGRARTRTMNRKPQIGAQASPAPAHPD